jgi:UDP-2,3-diacylglucosamine pyrophosphatase LpxH
MTSSVPAFAEVHVVSDLHLGGHPGFQIFNQGDRLARTIDKLASRSAAPLALVLNGDVFDFLAEDPVSHTGFDAVGVIDKVRRIVEVDPAFSPVFLALREFLRAPDRHLVIVLGNHDVEVALPGTREWLTEWLTQGAREVGRVRWAVDGAGFTCQVGAKRVLCVHGNEVDSWNVVDHRALLDVIRAINRCSPIPEWVPNAGTRLVVEVMNAVKREFPMVDLLKPETRAALPLVVSLDPSYLSQVGQVLRLSSKKALDGIRMTAGFLGSDSVEATERPTGPEALEAELRAFMGAGDGASLDERLLRARRSIERGDSAATFGGEGDEAAYLGIGSWFRDTARPEVVRRAFASWLKDDQTFKLETEDNQFKALDAMVGGGVDYLIAGHTHLRRAIRSRTAANRCYFNTGTWIRLIRIPANVLEDKAAFGDVFQRLAAKSMGELDAATLPKDGGPLVLLMPTVASVTIASSGAVSGALFQPDPDGTLVEVQDSRFPK